MYIEISKKVTKNKTYEYILLRKGSRDKKTDKRIKGHVALSMLAYNITLKLKSYTNQAKLDFKDTIGMLSTIQTTTAQLTKKFYINYIPEVNQSLQDLFKIMNFIMPKKVDY